MNKRLLVLCAVLLLVSAMALTGFNEVAMAKQGLKVGYVVNFMSHEWYQNIIRGARIRAEELGVDLRIADADNNISAQISAAENMIAQGVDVLVLTPVDANALIPVVRQAQRAGIPVITESNVVTGAVTYVGIDNKASGKKAGEWYVEYAKANNIDPRVLIVGLPAFEDCRLRVEGFKEALAESGIAYQIKAEVDGQGLKEQALTVSENALTANPDVNVIFGINDDSTTGGMAAYRSQGLNEDNLVAIGFGFEGIVGQSALVGNTPYKAALAMFPDFVGVSLIDAAVKVNAGEKLPAHYETPTIVITQDNFETFYSEVDGGYQMNFDAIRGLL